ncbi:MAG TPA: GNAT family N-acetyltransferase [Streptosporangiaceae bacterium]|jgi:RimJ/RimL family protein N-acetyltransferase
MAGFSPTVEKFWRASWSSGEVCYRDDVLLIASDPGVRDDRRVTILRTGSQTIAVLSPDTAERVFRPRAGAITEPEFRGMLAAAGITLHAADHLFYFTDQSRPELLAETAPPGVRALTAEDQEAFRLFESSASVEDLDAAYVELDHWAVVGAFDGTTLACVASMYPWQDSRLADLGVLTLPAYRGQGLGRAVVREICRQACQRGYEPQYRCQADNTASMRLAASSGLSWFGDWAVVSPDSAK